MLDFDFKLFPFVIAQTRDGEIFVMQISTGKTQRLKFKSSLIEHQIFNNIEGSRRMIQTDSNNLLVSSD
jgi:hypothetical protein